MINQAQYIIERHAHGWALCATSGMRAVPMNALSECYPMFPKKAVMDCGIGHHLNTNNGRLNVVVAAIATPAEADAWRAEIADSLKSLDPQDRWWRGCDVGMSSAAIFHSFCRDDLKREAGEYAKQSAPQDPGMQIAGLISAFCFPLSALTYDSHPRHPHL